MRVDGDGRIVGWLVKMKRLSANRFLDAAIENDALVVDELGSVMELLTEFYRRANVIELSPEAYRRRHRDEVLQLNEDALHGSVENVSEFQLQLLAEKGGLIDDRASRGKIVDAHGDLRPQHICLLSEPVVIDCIEFNPDFRALDPVSELTYLGLECERLRRPDIGPEILSLYTKYCGDKLQETLIHFYKAHHALTRAKIALWHLKDGEAADPMPWHKRAAHYLQLVQPLAS